MTSTSTARALAFLITALIVALSVRYNTFATWATDSGAYLSQGLAWARADLFSPATFINWAPWAGDGLIEAPLGHVQGPVRGTLTGQYPLGYPLLIAAAMKIGGSLAPHIVSPLLAGVLAWCAFVLGSRMATPWAGVLAAFLIASTPITFWHATMPFSDVPAVAFWALAWVMSVRPGYGAAMASGAATAFAVMIRPNLAPLALVIATTVAFAERGSIANAFKRVVVFGALAVLGPVLVMWSQAELYGDPMQSGYRMPLDFFFKTERIPYNARLYPRMLVQLHSWLAFAGVLFVPFAVRGMRQSEAAYTRGLLALSAIGLILVNYALYLPYLTYVGWQWLRFMLPALLALFVLLAAGLDHVRQWMQLRWPRVAVVALIPVVVVVWWAREHFYAPMGYERILLMQRYLAEALPPNATILTYAHGGALAVATGHPVVRLDVIAPSDLEPIIRDLQRRGHRPVYVFDVAVDGGWFADRFKDVPLSRLTWPARAEMTSGTSIVYYDISDRELFFSGERWATDVLVEPSDSKGAVRWTDFRATHERILLPLPEETAAFRSTLETLYRDRLGRAAVPAIDPRDATQWMRRYLRFRLHGCSHDLAASKVWQQMAEGGAPSLCARPDAVSFPPENETADFRRELEGKLSDRATGHTPTSSVDAMGEAVWMQRYIAARVGGCSHADATTAVTAEIVGEPEPPSCSGQ